MREQLHNLQALRGIACLAVVVFHVAGIEARFGLYFSPLRPALWFGYAGVDLFFVLSGFIIATTCRSDVGCPRRLPRYLLRRAWRIYPTFWAAYAITALVLGAMRTQPLDHWPPFSDAARGLLLLPDDWVLKTVGVAWTLWFEVMFYAAFGVLFLLPRRLAFPALATWGGTVLAASLFGLRFENRIASQAISPFVLEFLGGAAAAWRPVRFSKRQALLLASSAAAWCLALSIALFDRNPEWLPSAAGRRVLVFGIPSTVLVLALAGWERSGGRLGWRKLEAIGDASYSIYLMHFLMLLVVHFAGTMIGLHHSRPLHLLWLAAMLSAGILAPMLFYRWIERPLLRLAKPKQRTDSQDSVPARSAGWIISALGRSRGRPSYSTK